MNWLTELENFPLRLRSEVSRLSEAQLETEYRPGGWTVRQLVHHLADSHLNSYVRFRLALTEDKPEIKSYREDLWAQLSDARTAPIAWSLGVLEGLHARWSNLLRNLDNDEFARTFEHPELGSVQLDWALGLYAWHGRHHVAQVTRLSERMRW